MNSTIFKFKKLIRSILGKTTFGYKFYYKRDNKISGPNGIPHAPWFNSALLSQKQVEKAVEQVIKLGLPLAWDKEKNWDALAALDIVLKNTTRNSRIFDAGAEYYSMILPWLFLYGYKNLIGGNIVFNQSKKKGPILYEYADITNTAYKSNYFDAITCLSVIEHGINLENFFKEMYRILKPKGRLIISTDYFENKIHIRNMSAYDAPIKIFSKEELIKAIEIANKHGLFLNDEIDFSCKEKVVHWKRFNLQYTFIVFVLEAIKTNSMV